MANRPKVFISYSHDPADPSHVQKVESLAASLHQDGFEIYFDKYRRPYEDTKPWPLWMEDSIEDADFVLLICNKRYHDKIRQKNTGEDGAGVVWEASIIYSFLYEEKLNTRKFVPVILHPSHRQYIPRVLRGVNHYAADSPETYQLLCAYLSHQEGVVLPAAPAAVTEIKQPQPSPLFSPLAPPAPAFPLVGTRRVNPKDGQTYVWIPPGKFTMGASPGDEEAFDDEKPAREVVIETGFWIGQTPVTQAAYKRVTGKDPSTFKGDTRPVECVTWHEAKEYAEQIGMRLPTEAEWEYAARAGSPAPRYGKLDEIAWYRDNSGHETHPVGEKQPNAWGLYDTLGNVWEWSDDWYDSSQSRRTLRGGSWSDGDGAARVSGRDWDGPGDRVDDIGFRCIGDLLSL